MQCLKWPYYCSDYSDYKILPGWIKTQSSKGDYYYYNPKIKDSATFDVPIDKKYKFIEVAIKTYNNSRDDEIGYVNQLNESSLSGTCNLINSSQVLGHFFSY